MAVKLQFQFAGVDLNRPSSPHRKWFRGGLVVMGALICALCYWAFIHHLTHGHTLTAAKISNSAPVVTTAVKTPPAATVPVTSVAVTAPVVAEAPAPVTTAVVEPAPAAPSEVIPDIPATTVKSAPAPAPGVQISFTKPAHQAPTRAHTEQELLLMAGMTGLGNVLATANKYPDAYGFAAGDFLGDAKLGDPIPVYTIDESARANYRSGQPINPLLKQSNRWVFPVTLGDRICCMVQVKKVGKEFVPGTGSKALAMAWSKILENWPMDQGYHPRLVVNPQIPGYYFTVPELPMPNMTDTVMMTYFNPCTSPADVILASWR
jgi:hypothetical protein